MMSREVTIVNSLGLHARAAARFVRLASEFAADVKVTRGSRTLNGKSIMGLLLLGAACGTTMTISADGVDETDAIDRLSALVAAGFGEDTCSN
ncbi:MAG: HPr family phosphocarrier protein [Luteitalea sp.]|nr:HPr family phosphocarrier protein [Luteitalea sp.]